MLRYGKRVLLDGPHDERYSLHVTSLLIRWDFSDLAITAWLLKRSVVLHCVRTYLGLPCPKVLAAGR